MKLSGILFTCAFSVVAAQSLAAKRPLVVGDGFVLTGFREPEWAEKLL